MEQIVALKAQSYRKCGVVKNQPNILSMVFHVIAAALKIVLFAGAPGIMTMIGAPCMY
tara:strand:- start:371 stop:544 length:174 start_codon:yes stop_codon:yes gene_type:complete